MSQQMRQLGQFQGVSKQWKLLTADPTFQKTVVQKCEPNIIFLSYLKIPHKVGILRLIDDNTYSVSNYYLCPPLSLSPGAPHLNNILGSCYGLVCLGSRDGAGYRIVDEDLMLLNPWTKKFRLVKDWIIHDGQFRGHFGLGFDHNTHDFKLVKVCPPPLFEQEKKHHPIFVGEGIYVHIYSWREGCWHEMYTEDWIFTLLHRPGIFFEGKLYRPGKIYQKQGKFQRWSDGHQDVLVSFYLTTKTFGSIELPADLQGKHCSFGVAKGRLTATICRDEVEVWKCVGDHFRLVGIVWTTNRAHMGCLMEPLHQTRNVIVILQDGTKITMHNTSDRTNLHVLGHSKRDHRGHSKPKNGPRMEAVPLVDSVFSPNFETRKL